MFELSAKLCSYFGKAIYSVNHNGFTFKLSTVRAIENVASYTD